MAGTVAPSPVFTAFDDSGVIHPGALLYTYAAGTSTPLATYTDSDLATPHANPVVCDSAGRINGLYLTAASYKFVLKDSTDATTYWTRDNISAVPLFDVDLDVAGTAGEALSAGEVVYLVGSGGEGSRTAGRWYLTDADLSYASVGAEKIGVVVADIASGASGSIRVDGRVTGLSGLTAGQLQYCSATAGALTATAPAQARIVGIADSTTSIVISDGAASSAMAGFKNIVPDSRMQIWDDGDSAAPAGWTLTGTGAAIARETSSIPGPANGSHGGFAAKLTYGSDTAKLTRTLIAAGDFPQGLQGKTLTFGCWCNATAASASALVIDDGVDTTRAGETGSGTYHDGDSADAWIFGIHKMNASATKLDIYLEGAAAGIGYFTGITVGVGNVPLKDWVPERWGWFPIVFAHQGTLSTDTTNGIYNWKLPMPFDGIVERCRVYAVTPGTGADLIYDLDKNATSMYSADSERPTVDAGENDSNDSASSNAPDFTPDGTYADRCFAEGDLLNIDCKQVGSGTAGADATITVMVYTPIPELDFNRVA